MAKLVEVMKTEIENFGILPFLRKKDLEVQILQESKQKTVKCYINGKPAQIYIVQCVDENNENCILLYSLKGNRKMKSASMPYYFAENILKKVKEVKPPEINGWYIPLKFVAFPIYKIG